MKFLLPLGSLFIAGVLFFWYVSPTYHAMNTLRAETIEYNGVLARAKAANVKRDNLARTYNAFNDNDVLRLQKLLPDTVDTLKLIVDINKIVSKYGATVKDIKATEDKSGVNDPKPYGTTNVSFNVSLSYEKFLQLLIDLQHNLRMTDIASVSFQSASSNVYDFTINLKNYWLK